jgi:type IV secretory pathway TraG/TraD family ATPase VirD4
LKFAPTLPFESCCYNPLSEIRWETDYEVADAQTIANAVIRHGNDDSLYKHFEDAAVDLVSAGIIHLGYVFRNLDAPREPTLPDVLALYSSPGMDFQDVLKEIQSTVHMPGGKSNPRLEWFDMNGKHKQTSEDLAMLVRSIETLRRRTVVGDGRRVCT